MSEYEQLKQLYSKQVHINIRLPENNKIYYEFWLYIFASRILSKDILSVHYGKQDIRGTESITFIDKNHCVPFQKHFNNKWELLGFVIGQCQNDSKLNDYMGIKNN